MKPLVAATVAVSAVVAGACVDDQARAFREAREYRASDEYRETQRSDPFYYGNNLDCGLMLLSITLVETKTEEVRAAADSGDACAQVIVGQAYEGGDSVLESYETAQDWYTRAAEQGFVPAMIALAHMWEKGRARQRNFSTFGSLHEPYKWYIIAASRLTGEERAAVLEKRDLRVILIRETEIRRAQREAAEWDAAHPREP